MIAIIGVFWQISDYVVINGLIFIVLGYVIAVLVYVGYHLKRDEKKIRKIKQAFSDECKKIIKLKMKIKILNELLK